MLKRVRVVVFVRYTVHQRPSLPPGVACTVNCGEWTPRPAHTTSTAAAPNVARPVRKSPSWGTHASEIRIVSAFARETSRSPSLPDQMR